MTEPMPEKGSILPDVMAILLVVAGAVAIHFPNISTLPLHGADEQRDGQIVLEMLGADDLTIPRLDGQPYPDKPPFYFWAAAACSLINNGEITPMTMRLPSFVAGLLLLITIYLAGAAMGGRKAGLIGAAICATAICFHEIRTARMNTIMLLWTTWATLALFAALQTKRRMWSLLAGVCMGLALLTKGPFGFVMPMATIGSYLLMTKRLRDALTIRPFLATAVTLAIFLAWYIPASLLGVADHLTLSPFDHHQPIYYYFPQVFRVLAPWSPFLILAVIHYFRSGPAADRREWATYALLWFAATFVVVTLYPPKRLSYLLFLLPSFALLMGWYFSAMLEKGAEKTSSGRLHHRMMLFMTAAIAVAIVAGNFFLSSSRWGALRDALFPFSLILPVLFGCALWFLLKKQHGRALVLFTIAVAVGWAIAHISIEPRYQELRKERSHNDSE